MATKIPLHYWLLLCSSVLACTLASTTEPQQAFMVWPNTCILEAFTTSETRVEAPMRDGRPDLSQAKVVGMTVRLDMGCGHYETRRGK